jgi:hypothetical protein
MRSLLPAAVLCLSPLLLAGGFTVAQTAQPAPAAPAPATAGSDAAARHAKRTACLKEAKAKKLLGPDKTAYIKSCIAAP